MMQKYSVNQHLMETILAWVNSGEIAIPKIQRPNITNDKRLLKNLEANCIPLRIMAMEINDYASFLGQHQKLIAAKMKAYYFSL